MSDDTVDPDLVGVLRRLGAQRGGRIPYVQQLEAADCGAACLSMVAAYHGRALSLDQARALVGTSRGTNAAELTRGAEQLGLRTRAVRLELDALRYLPRGSILHWGMQHFVVLDRTRRRSLDIVDPAFGRRTLPLEHASKYFTGVALVFEPSHTFAATPPGRSKIWRYLGQLAAHPALIARVLVTSVALRVLALALPILTALVVDRVVPRGDRDLLVVVGGGIAIALGFQLLSTLIRSHLLIELRTKLDIKLTMNFVAQLLALPYAFFHRRSAGDLLLRIASNTQIRDLLTSSLLSTLLDGALAIGYLVLLVILSPTLALVTIFAGVLQLIVVLIARHRYAALLARDLESQARAHSYLVQMLVGIETLKVAGAEDRALEHWGNLYVDELNVALQRGRMTAVIDAIAGLLQTAAPLLLLGAGALLVLDHKLSLGTMLATTALATGFLAPLANLLQSALQLQLLGRYVERLEDVFAAEPEQQRASAIAPPRLTGAIDVQRVSFRYGPNEPLVVRDVTLSIAPGTTTAIVGRSGSGKSTLAALLLGIHRPGEGRISYDGYDVAELDRKLLRRQLGVVPQSPFMFSGSIRANIALSDPSLPLDVVIAAARLADIDADIRAMAMGYDTIISDGGATLSGGQRQRLALARALVHHPAVLLLDEATSSLDASTERAVMEQLRSLPATRILIAHRLSTIIHADQIVVMHDGRIAEMGTHTELLARRGVYAALVADQTFSAAISADAATSSDAAAPASPEVAP